MTCERTEELARGWIEAWIRMDMDWLRAHLAAVWSSAEQEKLSGETGED